MLRPQPRPHPVGGSHAAGAGVGSSLAVMVSTPAPAASHQLRFAGGGNANAQAEAELVGILTTKPRHVARRVRQMMVGSNRRIAQFRNTVTFLMIVLQTKLQSKEIGVDDAAIVIEGVMRECVALHQSDMAHLLFRAALRFKKFGVKMTVACVRLLFESYRGADTKDLMRQLAREMRDSPEHRGLAMAAFVYGGESEEAAALRQSVPVGSLTTEDFVALLESYGIVNDWAAFDLALEDALTAAEANSSIDLAEVILGGLRGAKTARKVQDNLFRTAIQNQIDIGDEAVGIVCRSRLEDVQSVEAAFEVEETLKRELKREQLGAAATTSVVAKSAMLVGRSFDKGDEVMLLKVNYLRSIVEAQIANDELLDIEAPNLVSIMRGYGILGKTEEMQSFFEALKAKAPSVVEHTLYLEVMKWHTMTGNVRAVLDLKREMEQANVYHHPRVYPLIFRALDRFYPKLTEQYYREMRSRVTVLDGSMYAASLRAFLDLRRYDMINELYAEMRARAEGGSSASAPNGARIYTDQGIVTLLRAYKADRGVFDNIIQIADKNQSLSHTIVQARVVDGYAAQHRWRELDAFVKALPTKTSPVYAALMYAYADKRDIDAFTALVDEMQEKQVDVTDGIYHAVSVCCSRFRDTKAVRAILNRVRAMVGVKSCRFFSTAAMTCHRLGDHEGVAQQWADLRASDLPITMETFNTFLSLHVQRHNVELMQDVLRTMMERVPPNPVTTTTVVDMLGKMGRLAEMEVLIDEMTRSTEVQPTLVTYHHAMHAYARNGDVAKMEAMRGRLRRDGLKENSYTFNILFDGYGRAKRYEHLADLIAERTALGVAMDDTGYAVLLNMYAKGRMTDEVHKTVEAILTRTATRAAESPATSAVSSAETPGLSARMTASIAEAYSYIHDLAAVEKYVQLTLANPQCSGTQVETIFLIYHRLRDVAKLDALLKKYGGSEFIYNVCVAAFAKTQSHERVAELLEVMKRQDLALHTNTAIILSSLLLKAGKVELAQAVIRWRQRDSGALDRSSQSEEETRTVGSKQSRKSGGGMKGFVKEPAVGEVSPTELLDEEVAAAEGDAAPTPAVPAATA